MVGRLLALSLLAVDRARAANTRAQADAARGRALRAGERRLGERERLRLTGLLRGLFSSFWSTGSAGREEVGEAAAR